MALVLTSARAQADTTTLCQEETAPVSGGIYTVQNNEFGSGAPECIGTDASAEFTVANSSIDNTTGGPPGPIHRSTRAATGATAARAA